MQKQPAKRPHAPQLLPSPNDDDHHPRVPSRRARSAEPSRRKVSSAALNAPPSVPCLLAAKTSTLVVSSDANFVKSTTLILAQMGVNVLGRSNVGDALCALEEDIAEHGCITFDQILCEAEDAGDAEGEEGAETLLAELKSTSWPASVVFVSSAWPTASVLQQHAAHGARAVVRKPVNAAELGRLFTHLKRRPHEQLFEQGRGVELVSRPPRSKPALTLCCSEIPAALGARSTPLHITAMGVGLVTFLHVHAGRQKGGGLAQTFEVRRSPLRKPRLGAWRRECAAAPPARRLGCCRLAQQSSLHTSAAPALRARPNLTHSFSSRASHISPLLSLPPSVRVLPGSCRTACVSGGGCV